MPVPYPRQDIAAVDDNGNRSTGFKDSSGVFRAVSETDPLPTVSSDAVAGSVGMEFGYVDGAIVPVVPEVAPEVPEEPVE